MRPEWFAQLSRIVWKRHPDRPCRFLFTPDRPPGLIIEPVSARGSAAFQKSRSRLVGGGTLHEGALLVDSDQQYVFCGPDLGPELLGQLAAWATENRDQFGGAPGLIDAGVATVDLEVADGSAIRAIDVSELAVTRQPDLWSEVVVPSTAHVARVLQGVQPGHRLWYWLWADAPTTVPPLLLEPMALDPVRDRLDRQIELVLQGDLDEASSGICVPTDADRLQFLGSDLDQSMLEVLADWVHEEVAEHPGLARLANCQLVVTGGGGRVSAILEDDDLWTGVDAPRGAASDV